MSAAPQDEFFIRRSWPLRQLGGDGLTPTGGIASACVAEYGGKRWLLSVSHAVRDGEAWGLELGFDAARGETKVWRLGAVNYVSCGRRGHTQLRDLDLAYVEMPEGVEGWLQEVNPDGEILSQVSREAVTLNFDEPDAGSEFGFAGNVQPSPEKHGPNQQLYLFVAQVAYHGLRYTGMEDEYAVFDMPGGRPDDSLLKGTSGAPILNHRGEAVALVCRAGTTDGSIRATRVHVLRRLLDVATGG